MNSVGTIDQLEHETAYAPTLTSLRAHPRRWLVTGGAGFIGSHLVEVLLCLGQRVTVLDDLSTGFTVNLDDVRRRCGAHAAARLRFVHGDIRDATCVTDAAEGAQVVLHHAAVVSVPHSIEEPVVAHHVNVTGFLHVLEAARAAGARVVYAASSASYGDDPAEVKVEDRLGRPLSMYAASKTANEIYASSYGQAFGLATVGLRYFNVFGPRQDPRGAYAAVIPAWIDALQRGERCQVHGDGLTTRDFCHVANVVGANLLAATRPATDVAGSVFNIGTGARTTLLELHRAIVEALRAASPAAGPIESEPDFGPFRAGDVRHSCADIGRARAVLGYEPVIGLRSGIEQTVRWFVAGGQAGAPEHRASTAP